MRTAKCPARPNELWRSGRIGTAAERRTSSRPELSLMSRVVRVQTPASKTLTQALQTGMKVALLNSSGVLRFMNGFRKGGLMLANRGFTIVEMLVVLLIIGILIGIMLPQVQSAITRTKEKVTINQVKAIEMALQEYAGKNRRCFPGSAIDIMAPFPYYSLGDGNFVQDGNNLNGPPKLPS